MSVRHPFGARQPIPVLAGHPDPVASSPPATATADEDARPTSPSDATVLHLVEQRMAAIVQYAAAIAVIGGTGMVVYSPLNLAAMVRLGAVIKDTSANDNHWRVWLGTVECWLLEPIGAES